MHNRENDSLAVHNSMKNLAEKLKDIASRIENRKKFLDSATSLEWDKHLEQEKDLDEETKQKWQKFADIMEEIEKLEDEEDDTLNKINELVKFYGVVYADMQSLEIEMRKQHEEGGVTIDAYSSILDWVGEAIDKEEGLKKKIVDKAMELKREELKLSAIREKNSSNLSNADVSGAAIEQKNTVDNIYRDIMRTIQEKRELTEKIERRIDDGAEEREMLEDFNSAIKH